MKEFAARSNIGLVVETDLGESIEEDVLIEPIEPTPTPTPTETVTETPTPTPTPTEAVTTEPETTDPPIEEDL